MYRRYGGMHCLHFHRCERFVRNVVPLYQTTRHHNPERRSKNVTFYVKIAQEVPGALYFVAHHSKIGTNVVVCSAGLIILLTWLQY